MNDKRYFLAGISIIPLITNFQNINTIQFCMILLISLLTVILQYRTSALECIEHQLIEFRDKSAENEMLLEEKNRNMREKQDSEIYLATLKERNRIAREIHDNVGHQLTRSILQLGALLIINKDETQKESLESLKDTLNNAMTSIRNSVHNLHDDSIDLKYAIEDMVKPMRDNYTINCNYEFSYDIPKKIKLCLIGIIKESLSNVVKHSKADKIDITIIEHPAFYQLIVNDNGKCDGSIKNSGIGLANMRNRAQDANGIITFTSSEKGFKVFVSIPKKQKEEI